VFRRSREPRDPVIVYLDGEGIPAERGEPLAVALLAKDKTILARSPKLHRPRGPSCLRGGCDGCLARVDGVPNVMTCLAPARGGEQIESQNVMGSRKADLLRVNDWFFPKGIDHHHLMAGVPGLSDVMQVFARKIAGLGRLPNATEPIREAEREEIDVAVVGGGLSGIVVASRAAQAGKRVVLVDDGISLGGSLAAAPRLLRDALTAYPLDGARVLARSVAAGDYFGDLLVGAEHRAYLFRARATVFATGAHDGVLSFPGNDLPGVMSARALCILLAAGLEPTGPVALVDAGEGKDFCAGELERALEPSLLVRVAARSLVSAQGTAEVHRITVRKGDEEAVHKVVAVALAQRGAPAFELPEQAGAAVRAEPTQGYVVVTDGRGRAAENVWAVGECTGAPFDPKALREGAERAAADVVASLG